MLALPQVAPRAARGRALAVIGLLDLAIGLGHVGLRGSGRRDSSGPPRARKRALSALLLGALAVGARAQDAPEPVTPEPVTLEPAPPAADAPAPEPEAPAPAPAHAAAGSPAEAFGAAFKEALIQENEVQEFERTTIGLEDPAKLTGFRLERRQRVDRDVDFNQRVRQFSLLPLELPTPADVSAANLNRQQLAFLTGLQSAYDSSRADPRLTQMSNLNRRFLQSGDWSLRDQAVKLREALVEREIAFNGLAEQAHALVGGRVESAQLAEMETALYAIAPELEVQKPDLSALVLQDPALAAQALNELQTSLGPPAGPAEAPPAAAELWPTITALQKKLVSEAGLDEVIAEHKSLNTELESLDKTIEKSEQWTDLEARMALVDHKVELTTRRDELAHQWHLVDPDESLYSQLIATQDQLIRRLMLDLGAGGSLFAARRDSLVAALANGLPPSADERWTLLTDQQELLEQLNSEQPVPDPLEAIEMLPDMPPVVAKPAPAPDPKATAKPKPKPKPKPKAKAPPKPKPKAKPKPKPKPKAAPKHYKPRH